MPQLKHNENGEAAIAAVLYILNIGDVKLASCLEMESRWIIFIHREIALLLVYNTLIFTQWNGNWRLFLEKNSLRGPQFTCFTLPSTWHQLKCEIKSALMASSKWKHFVIQQLKLYYPTKGANLPVNFVQRLHIYSSRSSLQDMRNIWEILCKQSLINSNISIDFVKNTSELNLLFSLGTLIY